MIDPETADDMRRFRDSFSGAQKWIYFDVAGRGLISRETRAAIDRHLDSRQYEGGDKAAMFAAVETARERFATLVNAAPDEIAFVKNVSDGLNAVAAALDWRAGDNVVLCGEVEHPSNIYVWYNLRDRYGIEVRSLPSRAGFIDPEMVMAAVDERTRIVTTASVTFAPGFRTDVETIGRFCQARGIFFLVDGAQSAGILNTDLGSLPIDGFATATQKGLLGLYGMGFLFVRRAWADRLRPVYLSRFGIDLGNAHEATAGGRDFRLMPGARRFDVGNYNYVACVAAAASIAQLLELGIPAIERHVLTLSHRLARGLLDLDLPVQGGPPSGHLAHILTLGFGLQDRHDATDDPMLRELHEVLVASEVKCSIRRGTLRFSLHAYNNESDVERMLEMLAAWRRSARWRVAR
jgi:cysteine desulfurase / selenocysteine lyase